MTGFFKKFKFLFSSPNKLFDSVKEEGFWQTFVFSTLLSTAAIITGFALIFLKVLISEGRFFTSLDEFTRFLMLIPNVLAYYLGVSFFLLLLSNLFLMLFAGLLGAKDDWKDTFKVTVYSSMPLHIGVAISFFRAADIYFLCYLLLPALICFLVLVAIGLKRLRDLSTLKAMVAVALLSGVFAAIIWFGYTVLAFIAAGLGDFIG
jgi:hypothetical protein